MPEHQDTDEAVLVALAQNGDRAALEALLRRLYRPLRAFVASMVGATHADDVLQEIAISICRNLESLRHPRAFRPWAFRVAFRRALRYHQRETRRQRLEADPEVISSIAAPGSPPQTLEPALLSLIEQVSPASRAALLLHYQQQLTVEETAAVLDIPLGTAKSRLAYGVSILRKLIHEKGTS